MRLLLLSAVAISLSAIASQSAACSPGNRDHVPAAVVRDNAPYLFKGVPMRTRKIGRAEAVTTYKVLAVYKGYNRLSGSSVDIRHPIHPGLCPLDTTKGLEVVLEPEWETDGFHANSLSVPSFTLRCEFDELTDPETKCAEKELRSLAVEAPQPPSLTAAMR